MDIMLGQGQVGKRQKKAAEDPRPHSDDNRVSTPTKELWTELPQSRVGVTGARGSGWMANQHKLWVGPKSQTP